MDIIEAFRQGKPVPVPVIDTHTHLGPCYTGGLHPAVTSDEDAVAHMERVGIDVMMTSPIIMEYGDMTQSNEWTINAMAHFPGKIYGNIMICPHDGIEAVRQAVNHYSKIEGFAAMKMLTGYHGEADRPEYAYALDFAQECGCPVTFHYWGGKPSQQGVERVLATRPNLKLILAHVGGGSAEWTDRTAALMKDQPNLYIDSCGSFKDAYSMKQVAEMVGDDRIVFGSDFLYLEPRFALGRIILSGMPEKSMRKIFSENYLRLLEGSQLTHVVIK